MASATRAVYKRTGGPVAPVRRRISLRVLRDGEETSNYKIVRVFNSAVAPVLVAVFEASNGITTRTQSFLQSAIDTGWLFLAVDDREPKVAKAAFLEIAEDGELFFDISSVESGGGSRASVTAQVSVERRPAVRDVVAVERQGSGEWRIAGSGRTDSSGGVALDLRVLSSSVFVLAVDDFGAVYTPLAQVDIGQRIRPTNYTGWLYVISEAGALPAVEPQWWAAVGENPSRPLGTARAIAVRYHQPQAHGPLPVEIT